MRVSDLEESRIHWLERRTNEPERAGDARSPGDVDYARVIHSASFRRLQGKTQILNLGDSDFYRTRLTHSLARFIHEAAAAKWMGLDLTLAA